ncbi:hypothetical protein L3V82_05415 [Thiotrichales bacterium 19S3-7]|nr:hypothetical protein [Thiotrichales bacterium 19S3-7]MCF6801532.1 hypothetical protein [Thiotrichales bacterium 19S3-11]
MHFNEVINRVKAGDLTTLNQEIVGQVGVCYIDKFGDKPSRLHKHQDISKQLIEFSQIDDTDISPFECASMLVVMLKQLSPGWLSDRISELLNHTLQSDVQTSFSTGQTKSCRALSKEFEVKLLQYTSIPNIMYSHQQSVEGSVEKTLTNYPV